MAIEFDRRMIGGREVCLWGTWDAPTLLVQPVDDHDLEGLASEAAHIDVLAKGLPYCLAAFRVTDWNGDLSPWPAPPVFGNEPFGGNARATLGWVEGTLLPALEADRRRNVAIGGYSLAGLFALYAARESAAFRGAAGISPSVWFPKWPDYFLAGPLHADRIYLSLGDRESRARNIMGAVGGNIQAMQDYLAGIVGVRSVLEWNPGNHFREPDLRTAKGFAWLLRAMAEPSEGTRRQRRSGLPGEGCE